MTKKMLEPLDSVEQEGENQPPGTRQEFFENLDIGLLSIETVALSLGKSPQTIKNWIAKRSFPFVRVGNRNWVRREGLERWLKAKEFKPWE